MDNRGCVVAVWLGTPCSSWSRARHDINGGAPRSKKHIWEVPNISAADLIRVAFGSLTLRVSVRIISKCFQTGAPVLLESCSTSLIFDAPPLLRLWCVPDYCQYCTQWGKRTNVLVWRADATHAPISHCQGRSSVYSRSHKHHVVLKGLHPSLHIPWTKVAEPYPERWSEQWSRVIVNAVACSGVRRMTMLCVGL